jgi:hypothetical protein
MGNTLGLASDVNTLIGGGNKKTVPTTKTAPTTTTKPTAQELEDFGNWTGQTDTKVMAADLLKRGLVNAHQLIQDNPNQDDGNSIINSQSDWKPAAISTIVSNARKYNLRTPEELDANRKVLMNSLPPRLQDAINDPRFLQIHPNWWSVINKSIIPQQWAKVDAANKTTTAKK